MQIEEGSMGEGAFARVQHLQGRQVVRLRRILRLGSVVDIVIMRP